MMFRTVGLLLLVALGAAAGWWKDSAGSTLAGAVAGAAVWSFFDAVHARRVLEWLKTGDASHTPAVSGVWDELLARSRKLVKKLEKAADASNARLDDGLTAVQASTYGVVLLDAAGRIEWCNPAATRHFRFEPQRDLGQYVRNLIRAPVFIAYLNAGDFNHEIQLDGADQQASRPSKIALQIHPYGQTRKLMISRDVTALLTAEGMRRDFVANVSHEIRTPLTVLSGFVETMQNLPLDETERQRYLSLMSRQAQRMQTLVSDLLTLSRLEGSPAPGQGEWCDADELLAQVIQEARGLSAAVAEIPHQIALTTCIDLKVSGARAELISAMSNLLCNAVRYTPGGGEITTGWRVRGDGWGEFFVTDTGQGIAAEHLPHLTERFFRVDRSRSHETGGTGLGLAIVKHVAQRHGGQIDVHSEPGKGSTFAIKLPPTRMREARSA